jgi:inactive STAND
MWKTFLEEIADKAGIRGKPRGHFLKIYECQDFTTFCDIPTKERYASLGFTSENSYNQLLSNFYDLLSPLMSEDDIVLVRKKGRQKQKDPAYKVVHKWLTDRYKNWHAMPTPDVAPQGFDRSSHGHKLHSELRDLAGDDQVATFANYVRKNRCTAYCIQTTGEDAQHWLVRRVAEKVSNFATSDRIFINLKNRYLGLDLSELWRSLSPDLDDYQSSEVQEVILDEIVKKCAVKNVIIVLYGIQKACAGIWESFDASFWRLLQKKMKEAQGTGKCILIVTGNTKFCVSRNYSENVFLQRLPVIELEDILIEDWSDWIGRDTVKQLWAEAGNIGQSLPVFHHTQVPEQTQSVLESVCSQLNIKDEVHQGIDFMRHRFWHLLAA